MLSILLLSIYYISLFVAGSDDAKGPYFPSHVYGSRADAPSSAVGIYSRLQEKKLPDIHEQSSVSNWLLKIITGLFCTLILFWGQNGVYFSFYNVFTT